MVGDAVGAQTAAPVARLEGEHLVVFRQRCLDLGDRRAGARRHHQFGGLYW
jgi:hypothetical protein